MSVAIRSLMALFGLVTVVSVGAAVYAILQKNTVDQQNQTLQTQITDYQSREEKLLSEAKVLKQNQQELNDRIAQKEKEREEIQKVYDDLKVKSDELDGKISQAQQERDDWKQRMETIRRERDDLMEKLKSRPVEKVVEVKEETEEMPQETARQEIANIAVDQGQGDAYWASVLREKAQLQLDLEKARTDLDQSALALADLKKQNTELQMEIKNLTDTKSDLERKITEAQGEFERKIKYQEDLTNNLSMEVARARSDQKSANDRMDKVKEENMALQNQLREVHNTKLALEKTIAQINQDKVGMQKKLNETEGVIQGRIDEIWQIKQNLDQKITSLPVKPASSEVELSPIIVNANGQGQAVSANVAVKGEGTIISINEANNFVIVDLGENDGSQVGRMLNVYRAGAPIGALEVIQVRKDISAADIKQSTIKLKIGDTVRY